jgi:hypothetical protein
MASILTPHIIIAMKHLPFTKDPKEIAMHDQWMSLPERKRKILMERSYRLLRKVADKQLVILDKLRKSSDVPKSERHLYFFTIISSFWRDGDFALALGKKNHSFYATYPVRTMMEKTLKMLWFINQKPEEQDAITKKELLKQCLDLYRIERDAGTSGDVYATQYRQINDIGLPDIDRVKRRELEAFPSYDALCLTSRLPDAETLYNSYRFLSGLPHGDLLSVFRMHQGQGPEEYRRVMMDAVRFCIEMLKLTDFSLQFATKDEVADIIKRLNIAEHHFSIK